MASIPAVRASSAPLRLGTSAHRRTPSVAPARTAASTSAAPAMAGTALGDTKETASISVAPASIRARMSCTRCSTGRGASDWRPSRGPTSRSTTVPGNDVVAPAVALVMVTVSPTSRSFADVDWFLGELAVEQRWKMTADLGGDGADVAGQQIFHVPPLALLERADLQRFKRLGLPRSPFAPADVDVVALVEEPATEGELRLPHPDARADVDLLDAGLLPRLSAGGVGTALAVVDATTGELPPRRLGPVGGVGRLQQQDPRLRVEKDQAGGLALGHSCSVLYASVFTFCGRRGWRRRRRAGPTRSRAPPPARSCRGSRRPGRCHASGSRPRAPRRRAARRRGPRPGHRCRGGRGCPARAAAPG